MDSASQLAALLDLAERMGIAVRRAPASAMESAEHPGGAWVRLRGKEMLFLNPVAPTVDQISAVVEVLKDRPELAEQFLPPDLRALLEGPSEA